MLFAVPFFVTAPRYAVIDFSYSFFVDSSLFIIGFNMETDTWKIIRPFGWRVWLALLIAVPTYWLAMCIADQYFEGRAEWYGLFVFTVQPLLMQNSEPTPSRTTYKRMFACFWLASAFVFTNAYAGYVAYNLMSTKQANMTFMLLLFLICRQLHGPARKAKPPSLHGECRRLDQSKHY